MIGPGGRPAGVDEVHEMARASDGERRVEFGSGNVALRSDRAVGTREE
jgi:hypothetical protein